MKYKKYISGLLIFVIIITTIIPQSLRTVNAEETEINPNGIENVVSENGTADGKKSDILAFFDFDSDAKDDVLSGINAKAMINGTNYSIVTEEEDYSGGYLHLGGNTFLDVKNVEGKSVLEGNSGNLTISYWSKTENTGSYNGWAFYAAKDAAAPSGNNEHYLGCMDRKTTLCVERYDTSPDVGRQQVNSINNLIADKWRHVVIVATSDKTKVYIDGQLKSEVSSTVDLSSLFAEDSILQIGKANWANGEYYTGAIDDFIVYDRALSEKEILDLSANDITLMNCEISITEKITVPRKSTDSIIVDMPISVDYEDIIVKFQAQDESVATVKADETDKTKINVTGIKAGETVVKTVVSCGGNQKRSFYTKVRVSAALDASAEETLADDGFTPLEKIILKKTETDILSLQLPQKVEGDAEKLVSYTSNDSEIAIVTGEGEVTGVSEGKTTITTTITIGKTSVSRETTVYVIPKGLIASYSFERNIVNEGGYSKAVPFVRDGEIKQEEDIIYEKGIFGEAIRLGEHGVKLNTLNIGNDFTFSMWLKPDNVKFNINKQVVYFGSEGKWMNIAGNNGSSRLKVWARGGIYQYTELIYNPVLTEGWQNFTVVGTDGKFELYKNGIYVDVTDSNNPLSGMNQDIIVGTMGGDDKKFTGLVDEVCVYNKALSREDVFNQYEKFREYFEENVDKKLNMEFILDNNVNENEVKYDLDLPTKIDDMDITWQSSNPDVIANDGTIKKAQNAEISLTATISIGVMTTTRKFAVKTIDLTKEMTTELSELMEKAKNANTAGWSDSAMKYLSESVSKAENAKTYDAVKTVMKRLKYAVKGEKEPYPGNPVHYCIDDGFAKDSAEWDYVFFGSYPQSEVTDEELIKLIDADAEKIGVKTDVGVDVWVNGEKYRRICQNDTNDPWGAGSQFNSGRWSDVSYMLGTLYRYYKYEPIKWRVLSNDGESLFLIADQALDCKSFDLPTEWDKCNMRKWLNKNFYQSAFNDLEKDAIIKKRVGDFNSNGVTKDKIQLISLEEITNSQFGFCTRRHDTQNVYFESDSRHFDVSTYAFARGARNNDRFWAYLRTHIPKGSEDIMGWDNKGEVREVEGGGVWYGFDDAIVPTLNVKMNSDEWKLAEEGSGYKRKWENEFIEKVSWYTTDDESSYSKQLVYLISSMEKRNLSQETRMHILKQFFVDHGYSDIREGIEYCYDTTNAKRAYDYLTNNETFATYQYWHWLNTEKTGQAARGVLWANECIFNNAIEGYLDPVNILTRETPGIKAYKKMLLDFMSYSTIKSENLKIMEKMICFLEDAFQTVDDTYANKYGYIEKLEKAYREESIEEAGAIFKEAVDNNVIIALNEKEIECHLDGYSYIQEKLKIGKKGIKIVTYAAEDIISLATLESKMETINQNKNFLQMVYEGKGVLPFEMRIAARQLQEEAIYPIEAQIETIYGQIAEYVTTEVFDLQKFLRKETCNIIADNISDVLPEKWKVSGTTLVDAIETIKFGAFCVNLLVGMDGLLESSKYTEAYAYLGMYYTNLLGESKRRFNESRSLANAWDFYDKYQILYNIRVKGEKCFLDMSEAKGIVGILAKFRDWNWFHIRDKKAYIQQVFDYMNNYCYFGLDNANQTIENHRAAQKAVIDCPVDVEVYNEKNELICIIPDGRESECIMDEGRFLCKYDPLKKEFVKAVYWENETKFTINAIGKDVGNVAIGLAKDNEGVVKTYQKRGLPISSQSRIIFDSDVEQYSLEYNQQILENGKLPLTEKDYIMPEELHLQTEYLNMHVGDKYAIGVEVYPQNANSGNIVWESGDETVATVFNGGVVAVGAGETEIRGSVDGVEAKCRIRVDAHCYENGKCTKCGKNEDGIILIVPIMETTLFKLDGDKISAPLLFDVDGDQLANGSATQIVVAPKINCCIFSGWHNAKTDMNGNVIGYEEEVLSKKESFLYSVEHLKTVLVPTYIQDMDSDLHKVSIDDGIKPTCGETGKTEGSHCEVCGCVIKKQETIPAMGHNYKATSYDWSHDGKQCIAKAVCANDSTHIITEAGIIFSKEKSPATCNQDGVTEYTASFQNKVVDGLFKDQTKNVADINAIGHSYKVIGYNWSKDGKQCIATAVCENDSTHIVSEAGVITSKVKDSPTCENDGITTYTATFSNKEVPGLFENQTKDVTDIKATGHSYIVTGYEWSEDGKQCVATAVCKNDRTHMFTENATITSRVKQPATCTETGITTYTAEFKNEKVKNLFTSWTKDVKDIEAMGHVWEMEYTIDKEPTETENGRKSIHCKNCDAIRDVIVIPISEEQTKDNKEDIGSDDKEDIESDNRDQSEDKSEEQKKEEISGETVNDTNNPVRIQQLNITAISSKIAAGKAVQMIVEVLPKGASGNAITWMSSNSDYATVSESGKVFVKKKGVGKTVTITAKANDGSGVKAEYKIRIMQNAVKKIAIRRKGSTQESKKILTAKSGKTIKLKAQITMTDYKGKVKKAFKANKSVQWITSNPKFATVSKTGKVKLLKSGKGKTVTITAYATDGSGKKAKIKIKIQ